MKTSKTVAKLLFVVGALVYLVGLWISCPLLSGKGYFLGVLMTATGFAPIFPDTCYHLTHYWPAAADIPV
ncbi:YiaA/YiaB family inner membrane protein, partial [Escherichia coli]|uniref:YiaA/YiaB family inner membrane protein n=1 Tax=Escherichia coli TaxID=562 RepID=UPI001FCEE5D4